MRAKVWKEGSRRGIAYVEDREAAEKVIALAAVKAKKAKVPVVQEAKPAATRGSRRHTKTVSPQEAALQTSGAMAVYWDRKGRPFAWQIPFDLACWEQVASVIGVEP